MSRAFKVRAQGRGRALYVDHGESTVDFSSQNDLQLFITQLAYYKTQADAWFTEQTDELATATATADNLTTYPFAGDYITLDAGGFAHSWGFSLYPGIDSKVQLSRRLEWESGAVPYQHEGGDALYQETEVGWDLYEEGDRYVYGTFVIATKRPGVATVTVGKDVVTLPVPDEHYVTVFCNPNGIYVAHAFPFKEAVVRRVGDWQSFGSRIVTSEPPIAFEIPIISGVVQQPIDEPAFQGDMQSCAQLTLLNNFYSLVMDYAGNAAAAKIGTDYSRQEVERNSLTLLTAYLASSLMKNAVAGVNVDIEFAAQMTAGMAHDPTIRGEWNTAVGGGDRIRNPDIKFGDKQTVEPGSVFYYDKDGVSFSAYTALSDAIWFGDSSDGKTGLIQINTDKGHLWLEGANWNIPVRVYKEFRIIGQFPTVSGAGAKMFISVESTGGTYEFAPDLTEEDGTIKFDHLVQLEYSETYIQNLQSFGKWLDMPYTGTNEVGQGPSNYYEGGRSLHLTWRVGWNAHESFVNECDHRTIDMWHPDTNTSDVKVNFKLSYVPPLYPQPTVVDQVEDALMNVALAAAIKIQVNSIKIASNTERIETLENMSKPTLLGALSGGILTVASFMQPGLGLTLAMIQGVGLSALDKIDRGYFTDGVTETIAMFLSALAHRRLGGGKVNKNDDFIETLQGQIGPKTDAQIKFAKHRQNFMESFSQPKYAVQLGQGSPVGKYSLSTNFMTKNAKKIGPVPTLTGAVVPKSFQKLYDRLKSKGVLPEHQSISINSISMVDEAPVGLHVSLGVSDGIQRNTGTFPVAAGPAIFPSEPGVSFVPHDGKSRVLSVGDFGGNDKDLIAERKARMLMLGYSQEKVASTPDSVLLNGWKEPPLRKYLLKTNAIADSTGGAPSAQACASLVQSMTNAAFREKWGYNVRKNNCQHFANSAWDSLKHGKPTGPASPWFADMIQKPLSGNMSREEFLDLLRDMNNLITKSYDVLSTPLYTQELCKFSFASKFDIEGEDKMISMLTITNTRGNNK